MGNAYEFLWELTAPSSVYHLDEAVRSLSFSPDGKQLIANGMGWNVIASDGHIDLAAFNAKPAGGSSSGGIRAAGAMEPGHRKSTRDTQSGL
jgi:hypothetical protein